MNGKEKIMNEKNNKKENQRTQKKRISFRVDDDELKFIQAKRASEKKSVKRQQTVIK